MAALLSVGPAPRPSMRRCRCHWRPWRCRWHWDVVSTSTLRVELAEPRQQIEIGCDQWACRREPLFQSQAEGRARSNDLRLPSVKCLYVNVTHWGRSKCLSRSRGGSRCSRGRSRRGWLRWNQNRGRCRSQSRGRGRSRTRGRRQSRSRGRSHCRIAPVQMEKPRRSRCRRRSRGHRRGRRYR